jgi:hypothetical protein
MTRPIRVSYTPLAASTTYLAASVTGASWALTTNTTTDGLSHNVTITNLTANTHASTNVTIVGMYGTFPVSETIALPAGNATVTSTNYYSSVTSVTPAATIGADTMSIGIAATASSPIFPINWENYSWPLANAIIVTGTVSYTMEYTYDEVFQFNTVYPKVTGVTPYWFADSNLTTQTSTKDDTISHPVSGERLLINSVTTGATVRLIIMHCNEVGRSH